MNDQRKYAILFAATILAAHKLNEIGSKPCPVRECAIADAISDAELIDLPRSATEDSHEGVSLQDRCGISALQYHERSRESGTPSVRSSRAPKPKFTVTAQLHKNAAILNRLQKARKPGGLRELTR